MEVGMHLCGVHFVMSFCVGDDNKRPVDLNLILCQACQSPTIAVS